MSVRLARSAAGGTSHRRYLFYVGHPAHYHLVKHAIALLNASGATTVVAIRQKDVLEQLLTADSVPYVKLAERRSKTGRLSAVAELTKREWLLYRLARRFRPNLMVGTSIEITHVGRLLGVPSIVLCEDDVDVVPWFARMAYPFASTLLTPEICDVGRWQGKKCGYAGYQKLAYLHPARFQPDIERVRSLFGHAQRYFLVRCVQLTAHHDVGIRGITPNILRALVQRLSASGRVHISSEGPLPPELEGYRIALSPTEIHHALAFAHLYVGDSQSMTVEAAVLGTPAIRVSDFAGRISVLEELERKYQLTIGIRPGEDQRLFRTIDEYIGQRDVHAIWRARRATMLSEKVDLTALLVWLIDQYPESHRMLRDDSAIQFEIAGGNRSRALDQVP